MQFFSSLFNHLPDDLKHTGCFVDTSVLFSATYPLDTFNADCEKVFDFLASARVPLHTNVNVRAEFLENHRRVLIAESLIDLLEDSEKILSGPLLEKLKSHRTSFRRKIVEEKSAKLEVGQIQMFRRFLSATSFEGKTSWEWFCQNYLHGKLQKLWADAEDDLGLNFVSLREGDMSPLIVSPLAWEKVVDMMGRYGIASNDAMIANMILASSIPALLTADIELAECVIKESQGQKLVFVPDSLG